MTPKSTPETGASDAHAEKASGGGKMVLIVEDEKPLSHALEMKLKSQGFTTKVVTNGHDAIEELQKTKYSLVLLDLIMPVMDGFGVLQEMMSKKIKAPVIVLSNLGQDEDRTKAKSLGAVGYFVKSNTPISEILSHVKESL